MAIHLRENQYQGINAHLHSTLQQRGDWSIFHGMHITHLSEALQAILPPDSGYIVVPEKSLQIIRDDFFSGQAQMVRTIPDVGIYKASGGSNLISATPQVATPGATVAVIDTFTEIETVNAIVIYKTQAEDEDIFGKPITRIELLSPANKPPGSHYPQYISKRHDTLLSGLNLVEIDYLHERRAVLAILADYPQGEPKAYPYVILVSHPYPSLDEGTTDIYGFRVDDPIPTIAIPLAGNETIALDLGKVYNHTFISNFLYGLRLVDYEKIPEGFDTYDEVDQDHIKARMENVKNATIKP